MVNSRSLNEVIAVLKLFAEDMLPARLDLSELASAILSASERARVYTVPEEPSALVTPSEELTAFPSVKGSKHVSDS